MQWRLNSVHLRQAVVTLVCLAIAGSPAEGATHKRRPHHKAKPRAASPKSSAAPTPPAPPLASPTPLPTPTPQRTTTATAAPRPAPASAPPPPESPTPIAAVVAAPVPRPGRSLELVSLALDGGVGARQLRYGNGATGNLRASNSRAVALLGFDVALHPFARTHRAFLEGLGVRGHFLRSVAARSEIAGSDRIVDETWMGYEVELHDLVQLGRSRYAPWLGVGLGYGRLSYAIEDDGQLIGTMPSVDYQYLRPGLALWLDTGLVTVAIGAGYRGVLAAGYVASHFPKGAVHGVDAEAALDFALPLGFRIGLRGEFAQLFYLPHAAPSDPFYAPNVTDRYVAGTLALAWTRR